MRFAESHPIYFEESLFDAVWSANVTPDLPDAELDAMLTEARRVLKPGGLLAIKDTEDSALQLHVRSAINSNG